MTGWQYQVLRWVDIQGVWLNKHGAEGWELVSVLGTAEHDAIYYFKRPIYQETKIPRRILTQNER
jgi:hypothetical protein